MKRILVYPCGTEIGLEIHRALKDSIHYELVGGSSSYDHGRFVYKEHIDDLPFITDRSDESEIIEFNNAISKYNIDMIYPAMDGVVTVFSKYRELLSPIVIAPDFDTTEVTRSKKYTYKVFGDLLPVPISYSAEQILNGEVKFPFFTKPDVGQGSVGAAVIKDISEFRNLNQNNNTQLFLEYLPGAEYTIDCFTNANGKLIFCKGRDRKRIKNGISVNAYFVERPEFRKYAEIINSTIKQKGGWFFQLRESADGELKLLEIASRIAGTSAITRNIGINLPLLTANVFNGIECDDVIENNYGIELDRAIENRYKIDLDYSTVYLDYDDTVVKKGIINTTVVKFIYQCINKGKNVVLLSKHDGDLYEELRKYRLDYLFDEVIHIPRENHKYSYITDDKSIFVDDSYGERKEVYANKGINVFDVSMIECLLED